MAHTPGPWKRDKYGHIMANGKEVSFRSMSILCSASEDRIQTAEDNTTLAAAAPDMFDALIDCRRALELANFTGELAVVDAAIAKAKGLNPDQG